MILQVSYASIEWIIGLGIMFGLALVFTLLTFRNVESFIIYLLMFNAFVVWADMLDLWTLVLNLIISSSIIYIDMRQKRGS
ncbi:MAG: hypothetical protein ACFFDH_09525 [Promethearchaeota archaeon]